METLVTILHVMVCIFLMLTVLLQAGKGGGMGAAFGGGSSMGTVFGGSGAGNFLRRLTVAAAVIFMVTSMTLAWMATPSTDPLKKYWADKYAAEAERKRAHEAALDDKPGDVKDEAVTPGEESPLESPAEGAVDEAPVEDSTEGEAKPAADEAKPAEGAADKPAAGAADKPAAGAADKPAEGAADKPAEDKPVDDKPVAPADKPAETRPADKPAATP
jgi:preprotein translocase subunit SecG